MTKIKLPIRKDGKSGGNVRCTFRALVHLIDHFTHRCVFCPLYHHGTPRSDELKRNYGKMTAKNVRVFIQGLLKLGHFFKLQKSGVLRAHI